MTVKKETGKPSEKKLKMRMLAEFLPEFTEMLDQMDALYLEKRSIDGKTCDRSSDTGETVRAAYATLFRELQPKGWTDQEIPGKNSIYLNGLAIEKPLPDTRKSENCCVSCGEILGSPSVCRTLERNGQTYAVIPAAMNVEAAHRFIETQTK